MWVFNLVMNPWKQNIFWGYWVRRRTTNMCHLGLLETGIESKRCVKMSTQNVVKLFCRVSALRCHEIIQDSRGREARSLTRMSTPRCAYWMDLYVCLTFFFCETKQRTLRMSQRTHHLGNSSVFILSTSKTLMTNGEENLQLPKSPSRFWRQRGWRSLRAWWRWLRR